MKIEMATLHHLLGHSDVSTTIGTYGHVDFDDLEGAMDALDGSRNTSGAVSTGNGLNAGIIMIIIMEAAGIEPPSALIRAARRRAPR